MADEIKQNLTEQSTWVRALYMVIFFVIYSVAEVVLGAVVIFQFLSRLLTAKVNTKLLKFGADLSKFAYEILIYLTYNSESKPFPFAEWPTNTDTVSSNSAKKESAKKDSGSKTSSKKRSAKKSKVTKIKQEKSDDDDGQNSGI